MIGRVRREKPRLLVMEGTGIAGGLVCLIAASFWKVPYIVSSGDAVGPFVASHYPSIGWLFSIYERILCMLSVGFIGWTPYLVGRALTLGAPRGVTAPGWVHFTIDRERLLKRRAEIRSSFGFSEDDIVFGLLVRLIAPLHASIASLRIVFPDDACPTMAKLRMSSQRCSAINTRISRN
jgi:hypothetical protein